MLKTPKSQCSGCEACVQACPVDAINYNLEKDTFFYPEVDNEICIKCNKCNLVCPSQEWEFVNETPKGFAIMNKNEEIRKESTSGGVFTLLSEYVIDNGGVVCGAWLNKNLEVEHILVDKKEDLSKLRGSKYVQSRIGNIFKDIKKELKSGRVVLFSGVPCQVAGLQAFLNKKYDNLLTIDLFCHGVPSQEIFDRYIAEEDINKEDITNVLFRDKKQGWNKSNFVIKYLKDGVECEKRYASADNLFMQGFVKNLYLRQSCETCKFATTPRVADISLGDFWGVRKYNKKFDDDKGTSAILVNTKKGEEYIAKIKGEFKLHKKAPLDVIKKKNKVLEKPLTTHKNRDEFFDNLNDKSFNKNTEDALGLNKVAIMNFHACSFNYGALVVPYSLGEALKKIGYQPEVVNFIAEKYIKDFDKKTPFSDFRRDFLTLSEKCYNFNDLKKLSKQYDKYIVGSDQVWRWHENGKNFFNWVFGRKLLLSYAASFGLADFKAKKPLMKYVRKLAQRFDAISVREENAIGICKKRFGVEAVQVIDPSLLLTSSDYEKIIEGEGQPKINEEYIGYMFLDPTHKDDLKEITLFDGKYENVDVMYDDNNQFRSFGDWLNRIKSAKYMVVDSFHGTCFSILFGKKFVSIGAKKKNANSRIESLLSKLKIDDNRLVKDIKDISEDVLTSDIDYNSVNELLEKEREFSYSFLKENLSRNLTNKKRVNNYLDLSFKNISRSILSIKLKKNKKYIKILGITLLDKES